ncbi:MAG: hypothetical protein JF616_17725 [Fibrobacteres bacterium]|jgi:hypothetical protein|nr:hypothetical protein [Fibrobacterota bacterium]
MATQKELIAFNRLMAEVEERLQAERRLHVEYVQVLTAAMKAFDEPNPEKLCGLGLTAEDVLSKLADYPFDAPVILGSVEAPDVQIPGGMGRIRAALGRAAGEEWKILSHPADPFPSDPYAHNEADDVDLDLSNGALYHDRQYVHTLFRKDLAAFRARVSAEYPGVRLPPMKET